jgi:hypothetical protein
MPVSKTNEAQIIPAPNALKLKIGGKLPLDMDAIARAEAALKSLSGQFSEWLQDEINKLDAARAEVRAQGLTTQTSEVLYMRAHDLKGLGTTYEFPLVSRIAASLCRLIDEPGARDKAPLYLIDAHIDAIKAAVRDNIKDAEHPVGHALVTELERSVREHLG